MLPMAHTPRPRSDGSLPFFASNSSCPSPRDRPPALPPSHSGTRPSRSSVCTLREGHTGASGSRVVEGTSSQERVCSSQRSAAWSRAEADGSGCTRAR